MRKRREWRENVAIGAIVVLAVLIGFPTAIYVHENARQWEALAVFISLGLGALPVLWYWQMRRYGWLTAILSSVLLMFSFTAALFHGWKEQAQALINIAAVVFVVVIFIAFARITRRMQATFQAIGEEINGDPLFRHEAHFRDDGQRIAVYPRRQRLVINCMIYVAVLLVVGIIGYFTQWGSGASTLGQIVAVLCIGLLALLIVNYLLAHIYRLIVRKPSLVVGPDGIFDDGTLIWSGVGLLRWNEILAVTPDARKHGWVTYHYLSILVTDLPAIRRRLSPLKRLALRIAAYSGISDLLVAQ